MGIAFVVVGGLVVMTAVASFFSYLGEKKKRLSPEIGDRLDLLEKRIGALETRQIDRDERVGELESELSFVNKLIEKRRE